MSIFFADAAAAAGLHDIKFTLAFRFFPGSHRRPEPVPRPVLKYGDGFLSPPQYVSVEALSSCFCVASCISLPRNHHLNISAILVHMQCHGPHSARNQRPETILSEQTSLKINCYPSLAHSLSIVRLLRCLSFCYTTILPFDSHRWPFAPMSIHVCLVWRPHGAYDVEDERIRPNPVGGLIIYPSFARTSNAQHIGTAYV
jgi:hypothetical protein